MGRKLTAIVGLGCCLTISGCSSAGVTAAPTTTTASQTTMSTPTTSATTSGGQAPKPKPPKMPALAKEKSPAGAKAFVKYYADLVNYSWATGDTSRIRAVGTKQCEACMAAADVIDKVVDAGGYKRGAKWHPRTSVLIPGQADTSPIVNVSVEVNRGSFRPSAQAHPRVIDKATTLFDFYLHWQTNQWKIREVKTT